MAEPLKKTPVPQPEPELVATQCKGCSRAIWTKDLDRNGYCCWDACQAKSTGQPAPVTTGE